MLVTPRAAVNGLHPAARMAALDSPVAAPQAVAWAGEMRFDGRGRFWRTSRDER